MSHTHTTDWKSDTEEIVGALYSVGSAWARYGLTVGRAALETSARSLEVTASALGQIAEALEQRQEGQHDDDSSADAPTG
jgi:hypothetical protein